MIWLHSPNHNWNLLQVLQLVSSFPYYLFDVEIGRAKIALIKPTKSVAQPCCSSQSWYRNAMHFHSKSYLGQNSENNRSQCPIHNIASPWDQLNRHQWIYVASWRTSLHHSSQMCRCSLLLENKNTRNRHEISNIRSDPWQQKTSHR